MDYKTRKTFAFTAVLYNGLPQGWTFDAFDKGRKTTAAKSDFFPVALENDQKGPPIGQI